MRRLDDARPALAGLVEYLHSRTLATAQSAVGKQTGQFDGLRTALDVQAVDRPLAVKVRRGQYRQKHYLAYDHYDLGP